MTVKHANTLFKNGKAKERAVDDGCDRNVVIVFA